MRFHRPAECVALQFVPSHSFVSQPQLPQRELLAQQTIGVGPVGIVRADVVDGEADDVGVVIR
jgi:hypothetical protein